MLICNNWIKLQCTTDIIAQNYRSFKNIWHARVVSIPTTESPIKQKRTRHLECPFVVTRTGICSARQGSRRESGVTMLRTRFALFYDLLTLCTFHGCDLQFWHARVGSIPSTESQKTKKDTPLGVSFLLVTRTGIEPMLQP